MVPLLVLLALAACGAPAPSTPSAPAPPPPSPRFRFVDVGAPAGASDVRVSPGWTWADRAGPVRLQRLVAAGAPVGDVPFGQFADVAGRPLAPPYGSGPWVSDALDFAALYDVDGVLTLATHLEDVPATIWRTTLALADDGTLTAVATRPADLSGSRGARLLCAGDATPWGTHLAAEEYEPDAASTRPGDLAPIEQALPPAARPAWVYDHGWVIEVTWARDGEQAVRHTGLGRFSHELALVLPDERTVVLTDDLPSHGGLFLFVADRPRDLTTGSLYALRYDAGRVTWVRLGRLDAAGHAHHRRLLDERRLGFDDLATEAAPTDGACPAGSHPLPARGAPQRCVTLVDPALTPFFETRRHAAVAGATVEWSKAEGLAVDPGSRRVFVALSTHLGSAADGTGDVALEENPCGAVWALDGLAEGVVDAAGAPIPSSWVPTRFAPVLAGRPEGSGCAVDGLANPDNLTFLDGLGLLVIAEDTVRHDAPTLWAWDPSTPDQPPARIATAPPCGEWSGLHWFPDLRGHGWLTVSMQHAWAHGSDLRWRCGNPFTAAAHPLAERTWAGVIGPLPPGR